MTRPRALSFRVPEDVNEWPKPAWVPDRQRAPDCPVCRGMAVALVGGVLLWGLIATAAWHLWGRP